MAVGGLAIRTRIIIVAFCRTDDVVAPDMIVVDERNRLVRRLNPSTVPEDFVGAARQS